MRARGTEGYVNGLPVRFADDAWRWADGVPVADDHKRPCPHCGKPPGPNGEDGCLGRLPGVKVACCGHGRKDGYIIFENGTQVRFKLTEIPALSTPSEPQADVLWVEPE